MRHRVPMGWALVVIAAAGMAGGCSSSSTEGWKVSQDPSGSCEVSTPPGWQPGRDFFLARETVVAGPIPGDTGLHPPMGAGLWGVDASDPAGTSPLPSGTRFQVRASLVSGETACSVWRIKESTDFTAEEKDTMQRVGKTLQAVP